MEPDEGVVLRAVEPERASAGVEEDGEPGDVGPRRVARVAACRSGPWCVAACRGVSWPVAACYGVSRRGVALRGLHCVAA